MPSMKNFSAVEEEDDENQLCRDPEAEDDEDEVEEDSKDRSQSDATGDQSDTEVVEVDLADIRKDVECPICLGIIRKTRTVMECLHRFCQECIDKSMRLGNNECPACREHCASRRSLRDDPKFDAFIAALFGDIDAFEAKENAFREEEQARNMQIQESVAQISLRQSEALVKQQSLGKEAAPLTRSQRSGSGTRKRKNRNVEQDTSGAHDDDDDDDDDDNNRGKDSSSDEPYSDRRVRKQKKRSASRSTVHPSASNANNNNNAGRDSRGLSPQRVLSPEVLAWGRGGIRSNTRQGNNNQGDGNNQVEECCEEDEETPKSHAISNRKGHSVRWSETDAYLVFEMLDRCAEWAGRQQERYERALQLLDKQRKEYRKEHAAHSDHLNKVHGILSTLRGQVKPETVGQGKPETFPSV